MNNNYNNSKRPKTVTPKEDSIAHKVGDAVERFGEKVIKAGAPKLGKAIYNAGDKLEHMNKKR